MSDIEKEKLNLRDIKAHNPKNKIRESAGYRVFTVFNTIIMILVSVATLYPFLYLISQSFTSTQAIIEGYTGLVPKGFFHRNRFVTVLFGDPCLSAFKAEAQDQ